ncbi:hypothetical protein EV144_101885 [Flavobacterium sp. 270]|uniref:hypothetical protein n=1 Tax=Flavobacterium sp. 270 TaxID=2512114 RepID=UPI0010658D05|nr:hypothetical protein [Flavobacterium sp. 270]TDW52197.1 hypothetical protein EV144_101885 [Flavobacterium sp. 270]
MNIELFLDLDYDNQKSQIITIEINENLSIGELLSKIHKKTKTNPYREIKWGENVHKISCSYYFKSGTEFGNFQMISDLEQKISDFPKNGKNQELSLFIDENFGLVN